MDVLAIETKSTHRYHLNITCPFCQKVTGWLYLEFWPGNPLPVCNCGAKIDYIENRARRENTQ